MPQVLQHWQHLANAENQLSTAVNAEAPIRDLGRQILQALIFMTVHTFSIISESIQKKYASNSHGLSAHNIS